MKWSLRLLVVCFSVMFVTVSSHANDNPPTPEDKAFKFRTSLFQTFSWKLGQMAGAKAADDEAAFTKHQNDLVYLSSMLEEGFKIKNSIPEGSDAKPEIWEDYEGFKAKVANMETRTKALSMSDFDPREFGSKACGSCHRDFRVKRN